MAIDDNTIYGLYGSQIKDLPEKINAVKGMAKALTADDYNWPTNNPDGIAIWLLSPGYYVWQPGVTIYPSSSAVLKYSNKAGFAIVGEETTAGYVHAIVEREDSDLAFVKWAKATGVRTSDSFLMTSFVIDNLTSTMTNSPLSAKQGKVLKDLVDSLAIRGAAAPTTSTVGQVGTLYEDTTNGDLYICTDATNPYVWEEVGAGGGESITVLTTADYNYPENNPTSVAAWLLEPGMYTNFDGTSVAEVRTSTSSSIATFSGSTFIVGERDGSGNSAHIPFVNLSSKTIGYMTANGSSSSLNVIPSVVQTTGTSTTDVMSQNAVTSMVYQNAANKDIIRIGDGASANSTYGIAIGANANSSSGARSVAIGVASAATGANAVAIGRYSSATAKGQFDIGCTAGGAYNDSNYRLLTGLYDPQSAHDAATKGYVDTAVAGAGAAAFTTNEWNALWA